MTRLQKLKLPFFLNSASSNITSNHVASSESGLYGTFSCSYRIAERLRFYSTEKGINKSGNRKKLYNEKKKEAQVALLDYLHSTRSLLFMDAENMSKNSPLFLGKLLKRVNDNESGVGRSISRFLRYHPINEFEPFFESMGLKPCEYSAFLPQELIYLNDDKALMRNYHLLCNYGIPRQKLGVIWKEAPEVFRYNDQVLESKLKSFEEVGLRQSTVIKVVVASPYLLSMDRRRDFFKVVEKLKSFGMDCDWVGEHVVEGNSYSWSRILETLCLFDVIGLHEDQSREVISQHPELLFESSGDQMYLLVGFLLKFGSSSTEIYDMFLQFPQIPARSIILNMRRCYQFFVEVQMPALCIGDIVRAHSALLGSCSLKKAVSLLHNLNTGKKRICEVILKNPHVLKDWVLGKRVKRLPNPEDLISQRMKTKFLLDLGFQENSNEMKRALKLYRGKGLELQERFNCFVNAGLDRKDVIEMVKVSPQIVNQTKETIEKKIEYLVNTLGYPLSSLVSFPSFISYTNQRVMLRLSMYNWLKDQGKVHPNRSLSTLIASQEKEFVRIYVNTHPEGPKIWQKLKKEIYPD